MAVLDKSGRGSEMILYNYALNINKNLEVHSFQTSTHQSFKNQNANKSFLSIYIFFKCLCYVIIKHQPQQMSKVSEFTELQIL